MEKEKGVSLLAYCYDTPTYAVDGFRGGQRGTGLNFMGSVLTLIPVLFKYFLCSSGIVYRVDILIVFLLVFFPVPESSFCRDRFRSGVDEFASY